MPTLLHLVLAKEVDQSALKAEVDELLQSQTVSNRPWIGIKILNVTLRPTSDAPMPPLYKNEGSLAIKIDYELFNYGNSTASRVAADFLLGADAGGEVYHDYACKGAKDRSRDRVLAAQSIFQHTSIAGSAMGVTIPARQQTAVIAGCVVYKDPNTEELHTTEIVFQFALIPIPDGFAPTGFEARNITVRYVEPF
jgi:hypothetical protein